MIDHSAGQPVQRHDDNPVHHATSPLHTTSASPHTTTATPHTTTATHTTAAPHTSTIPNTASAPDTTSARHTPADLDLVPAAGPTSPRVGKVVNHLIRDIAAQRLRPGQRMPAVRQLARQMKVTYSVAHAAVQHLQSTGRLQTVHGRGTFVARSPQDAGPSVGRAPAHQVFVLSNDVPATFAALMHPIVSKLQEAGITVTPLDFGANGTRLGELAGIFERWTTQPPLAVIVKGGAPITTDAVAPYLAPEVCRVMAYGHPDLAEPGWHLVSPDEGQGFHLAAQCLLQRGHRRLGLITTRRKFGPHKRPMRHIAGILRAFADASIKRRLKVRLNAKTAADPYGLGEDEANVHRLARWLRQPDAPSGFITATHRARCLELAADLAGLKIGRDIDLVTYGEPTPAWRGSHPCVWERHDLVAEYIAQLVLEHLHRRGAVTKHVIVQPELVEPMRSGAACSVAPAALAPSA